MYTLEFYCTYYKEKEERVRTMMAFLPGGISRISHVLCADVEGRGRLHPPPTPLHTEVGHCHGRGEKYFFFLLLATNSLFFLADLLLLLLQ